MDKTMKATTISQTGSADVLEYSDMPIPAVPPGCVLVKVSFAGLSFGDIMIRGGAYPDMPPMPYIPGFEACGTVVQTGEGVDAALSGQRVAVSAMNTQAEYIVAPAAFIAPAPDGVSDEMVAAVPANYMTALKIMDDIAQAKSGETVLIHAAAGGVGVALLQLAKLRGLKTIGIAGGADKCAFALEQGAGTAIDYLSEDVPARVKEITEGKGVDISFNSVCGDTLMGDLDVLNPYGRLVVYGMAAGPPPPAFFMTFLSKFSDSISLHMFSFKTVAFNYPAEVGALLRKLMGLLAEGKIAPPIFKIFDLKDAAKAHELMESRKIMGKVVFKVNS
ncbi:MAG: zinc-binding dehydrogenase [Robiginitomaculum sp.]|nr:zinc-binding dehydrogenase [Robiginitomaculum sp.]